MNYSVLIGVSLACAGTATLAGGFSYVTSVPVPNMMAIVFPAMLIALGAVLLSRAWEER